MLKLNTSKDAELSCCVYQVSFHQFQLILFLYRLFLHTQIKWIQVKRTSLHARHYRRNQSSSCKIFNELSMRSVLGEKTLWCIITIKYQYISPTARYFHNCYIQSIAAFCSLCNVRICMFMSNFCSTRFGHKMSACQLKLRLKLAHIN